MVDNKTFATKAITYFNSLHQPKKCPGEIRFINPYNNPEVKGVVKEYFSRFYNDNGERLFVIGINPGRFGGGLTGISFTDPVALRDKCRIENNFGIRKELSSTFIYNMIDKFGGVEKFFSRVFLTALYPLAIIKDGKNHNYYDEKKLIASLREDIVKSISTQIGFGARDDKAIILGKRNAEFFIPINAQIGFFRESIVLDHPRYIMQYKLKSVGKYIQSYISVLK